MLWLGLQGRRKLHALENELEQLRDDLGRQQRSFQQLEIEWANVLDKVQHAMGRVVARQRRAPSFEAPVQVPDADLPEEFRHLDEVSKRIIREDRMSRGRNGA